MTHGRFISCCQVICWSRFPQFVVQAAALIHNEPCNELFSPPPSMTFILSSITNMTAEERSYCGFEWAEVHLRKESGLQFIQEAALTSHGKSSYTHGRHVLVHMLKKHTPSTSRISSVLILGIPNVHTYMHEHTQTLYNPRGQLSKGEIEREIG